MKKTATEKTNRVRPTTGNSGVTKEDRENERKWSKQVWGLGWTGIPFILLEHQQDLGLEPVDFNVLVQLLKHWWRQGEAAWPTKRSIASRIGLSEKSVQRSIARMQRSGILESKQRLRPDGGKGPNEYRFDGLVAKLKDVARKERERRNAKGGKVNA